MKFVDALGNIKYGKAVFFGNNIFMSETADGVVTINAAILSGTGSSVALLGDVLVSSLQNDQFLRYDTGQTKWVNQFITAADVGAGTFKVGAYIFPNTLNITGNTTTAGNLVVSGTTSLVNPIISNIIVSGTTTLVGVSKSQVGTSAVYETWPNCLYDTTVAVVNSGTVEISFGSYLLKANTLNQNGGVLCIRAIYDTQVNSSFNYNIKFGSFVIASGFIGANAGEKIEVLFFRQSTSIGYAFQTQTSGTAIQTNWFKNSPVLDFTADNLIDFRGRNVVTSSSSTNLRFIKITYEPAA